mgnify:CR=1 FL=1
MARPSRYKAEFAEQAAKLCRLGATDKELAEFFGVTEKTINNWKGAHPEFLQSLKAGKQMADAEVADKLFQRAIGYSHPDTHISNYQGLITVTPITKHYPPDPTSMIFWLKNRRPDLWRDKPEPDDGDAEVRPVRVEISVKDARIRDDDQSDTEPAASSVSGAAS